MQCIFVRRRYTAPFKFNTAGLCTEGKKGGRKAGEQATSKPLCRDAALTHSLAHLLSLFFFPAAAMMITNLRRTDGRTDGKAKAARRQAAPPYPLSFSPHLFLAPCQLCGLGVKVDVLRNWDTDATLARHSLALSPLLFYGLRTNYSTLAFPSFLRARRCLAKVVS